MLTWYDTLCDDDDGEVVTVARGSQMEVGYTDSRERRDWSVPCAWVERGARGGARKLATE